MLHICCIPYSPRIMVIRGGFKEGFKIIVSNGTLQFYTLQLQPKLTSTFGPPLLVAAKTTSSYYSSCCQDLLAMEQATPWQQAHLLGVRNIRIVNCSSYPRPLSHSLTASIKLVLTPQAKLCPFCLLR